MKLSEWLVHSGTSQSELARRLGITQGRVSQLVGGAQPSLELANRIAAATGNKVRPQDFGDQTMAKEQQLDTVEEAVKAIAAGQMVVVVDDDDRENEGDLIAAAAKITAEQMAFMVRHTSGIVCTPITPEDAKRLKLDPMVALNDAPMGTAFTVTIDYKEGLTTGISAKERAATCHALANRNVVADDFVRPGHIFPLVAKSGGVLMRSGHTEAAVDLVRLAGLHPAGVICELVNDDGSVKRGPQNFAFAREHGLKIISVADLIAYRQRRERLVEQTAQFDVETAIGKAQGLFLCDALRPGGAAGPGVRRRHLRQSVPVGSTARTCWRTCSAPAPRSTRCSRCSSAKARAFSSTCRKVRRAFPRASSAPRNPAAPPSASRAGATWASAPRSCAT